MRRGRRRVHLKKLASTVALTVAGVFVAAGCADRTPPPANSRIPHERAARRDVDEPRKPMPRGNPEEDASIPPPPFNDVPLVVQETPEQRAFVDAYNQVGRPRMVVFVNRTLEGELTPVNGDDPVASVERTRRKDDQRRGSSDRVDVYLRPGQYDEAVAKQIDYEAIETVLTDWLAAGGKTEIVSPITARQRLTDEQVKELQSGRPKVMGEVARQLDADVLIHVTARPTRQTDRGLEVRLVAEALNLGKDGQSIGRGFVDMTPPLDKPRINKFTRFLARVLMDRMIGTWENMAASEPRGAGPGPNPGSGPGPVETDAPRTNPGPRLENAPPPAAPLPPAPDADDKPSAPTTAKDR